MCLDGLERLLAVVVGIEEEVGEPQSAAVWGGRIQLKSELGERGWGEERGCMGVGMEAVWRRRGYQVGV